MATHVMYLPREQEHLHRAPWAAMASGGLWAKPAASCGGNTWSKRLASTVDSDSWEVRAFAEDASSSGQWPPRSYSCSFCQREFRTAQALGGHMNVHRRERAHANQLAQLRNGSSVSSHPQPSAPKIGTTDAGNADFSWLQSLSKSNSSLPPSTPPATVDLLSAQSLSSHLSLSMSGSVLNSSLLSTSPLLQESISSSPTALMQERGTKPLLQSIPDILSETLQQTAWTSSRGYHPYERSRCKDSQANLGRFSLGFTKIMGDQEDTLDLELRLGQSSCAV